MKRHLSTFCVLIALSALVSACGPEQGVAERDAEPPVSDAAATEGSTITINTPPPPPPEARTVEEFDTATPEDRAVAAVVEEPAGETDLGTTVASLGDPSEPGFWLKTPLVSAPAKGRVLNPATGKSAQVELLPIDGPPTAGSRISLSAMRLIGASLTDLPTIRVFRD